MKKYRMCVVSAFMLQYPGNCTFPPCPPMDLNYLYCPQGYMLNISCLLFLKTTRYKNTKKPCAARISSCNPYLLIPHQLVPITKVLVLQAFYIWSQQILNLQLEFVSCFFSQNFLPVSMNECSWQLC